MRDCKNFWIGLSVITSIIMLILAFTVPFYGEIILYAWFGFAIVAACIAQCISCLKRKWEREEQEEENRRRMEMIEAQIRAQVPPPPPIQSQNESHNDMVSIVPSVA